MSYAKFSVPTTLSVSPVSHNAGSEDVSRIRHLCDPYDQCQTECDGQTRILHTVLTQNGIFHSFCFGEFTLTGYDGLPLHFWLTLPNGFIVDYRLRMWYNDTDKTSDLPHGVFDPNEYPEAQYVETFSSDTYPILEPFLFDFLVTDTRSLLRLSN